MQYAPCTAAVAERKCGMELKEAGGRQQLVPASPQKVLLPAACRQAGQARSRLQISVSARATCRSLLCTLDLCEGCQVGNMQAKAVAGGLSLNSPLAGRLILPVNASDW